MFMTQFHATLDELCTFIEESMDRYPQIVVSAFAFPPSRQVSISRETIREVLAHDGVDDVVFTERVVDPAITSAYGVARGEYEALYLDIGRLGSWGLAESTLGTKTVTPLWKKLNAALKKQTTAGADVGWDDGTPGHHNRNHRFTAGARALAASGVPLRQSHQSTNRYTPT